MADISFQVNGQKVSVSAPPDKPLLWVLREDLKLTGTKFGCGMAQCGACTVHLEGAAVRSCILPVAAVSGKNIQTIEGVVAAKHPLIQAWVDEQVPQCGYCQSGQIMSAAALLAKKAKPEIEDIHSAMEGNLCRCGTYPRIRKAILRAAKGGS
ncbi:MAG: (2Fe-2S)-binding protein [Spirochaetia bacterium]|nr:(2Fe-2S)-binding protein [Spirochaetia bacterium]